MDNNTQGMIAKERQQAIEQPASRQQGAETEGSVQATAAEQKNYEKVILAATKAIYDESTHDGIMQMLQGGEPAESLAKVTTTIMLELDRKSGGKIPEDVILPASAEVLELVAELAQESGTFPVDEAVTGKAMQMVVMELAEQYGINPEELNDVVNSISKEELGPMVQQQAGFAGQGQQAQPAQAQPAAPQPAVQPGG